MWWLKCVRHKVAVVLTMLSGAHVEMTSVLFPCQAQNPNGENWISIAH
jgi:hypothetical protein